MAYKNSKIEHNIVGIWHHGNHLNCLKNGICHHDNKTNVDCCCLCCVLGTDKMTGEATQALKTNNNNSWGTVWHGLSNQTKSDPWRCPPYHADDPLLLFLFFLSVTSFSLCSLCLTSSTLLPSEQNTHDDYSRWLLWYTIHTFMQT